jgi:hypothetical protein
MLPQVSSAVADATRRADQEAAASITSIAVRIRFRFRGPRLSALDIFVSF